MELLNQRIGWNKLPSSQKEPVVIPLSDAELQIPHCLKKAVSRRAVLRLEKEKMRAQGELVRLLEIEIQFAPFEQKKETSPRYFYRAVARKMCPITAQKLQ